MKWWFIKVRFLKIVYVEKEWDFEVVNNKKHQKKGFSQKRRPGLSLFIVLSWKFKLKLCFMKSPVFTDSIVK